MLKTKINEVVKEILSDNYLSFSLDSVKIEETSVSSLVCLDISSKTTKTYNTGNYCGLSDNIFTAGFSACTNKIEPLYTSIKNIRLISIKSDKCNISLGAQSPSTTIVTMRNGHYNHFEFLNEAVRNVRDVFSVIISGLEFFVNAERAFVQTKAAMIDAAARNRQDLLERLGYNLSYVTQANDFSRI